MMEMGRERQRMVGVYGQKLRGNDREAEGSMGRQGEGMDLPRLAFASGYGPAFRPTAVRREILYSTTACMYIEI